MTVEGVNNPILVKVIVQVCFTTGMTTNLKYRNKLENVQRDKKIQIKRLVLFRLDIIIYNYFMY